MRSGDEGEWEGKAVWSVIPWRHPTLSCGASQGAPRSQSHSTGGVQDTACWPGTLSGTYCPSIGSREKRTGNSPVGSLGPSQADRVSVVMLSPPVRARMVWLGRSSPRTSITYKPIPGKEKVGTQRDSGLSPNRGVLAGRTVPESAARHAGSHVGGNQVM